MKLPGQKLQAENNSVNRSSLFGCLKDFVNAHIKLRTRLKFVVWDKTEHVLNEAFLMPVHFPISLSVNERLYEIN